MTKKKKIIILSCMIALLAVTAVFNFALTTDTSVKTGQTTAVSSANYFEQYRTERITTRNEEILQLDSIISAAKVDSAERSDALNMKKSLTEITERELLLETLIKAYGFEDAVVVIGLESSNVNVIAKCANLTTDDAIAIYTIVSEETSVTPENVKIIPIS